MNSYTARMIGNSRSALFMERAPFSHFSLFPLAQRLTIHKNESDNDRSLSPGVEIRASAKIQKKKRRYRGEAKTRKGEK